MIEKLNELFVYLNKYNEEINSEGFGHFSLQVKEHLEIIKQSFKKYNKNTPFSNAELKYNIDKTIQFISHLDLPASAKTTTRVFRAVIAKEIGSGSPVLSTQVESFNDSFLSQGKNYEKQAASTYNVEEIRNNLLCAYYCFKQEKSEADITRIEDLLKIINTELTLPFAYRYLFAGLKNHDISFNIHHQRFSEVLTSFIKVVNETSSEEAFGNEIMRWVSILKKI